MQPIEQPKSLMEATAEKIRDAIVFGELPLGSKLSEQRLADALAVSRSPVRDALAALQSEGLVSISPKRGSFVFTPDMRVVDELCEHRAILETSALRLGMERNPVSLLQQLQTASADMQKALTTQTPNEYSMADDRFHSAIIRSAGNRSLEKSYGFTISPLKALRTHLFTIMSENADRSMSEHIAVIDAIRARKPDAACQLLVQHIGHLAEAFRTDLSSDQTNVEAATAKPRKAR